jgi:hypothetical protein
VFDSGVSDEAQGRTLQLTPGTVANVDDLRRLAGDGVPNCGEGVCRLFTEHAKEIETLDAVKDGQRLYLVRPGRPFFWPTFRVGYKVRACRSALWCAQARDDQPGTYTLHVCVAFVIRRPLCLMWRALTVSGPRELGCHCDWPKWSSSTSTGVHKLMMCLASGKPIVLTTLSESPRVFDVENFFTAVRDPSHVTPLYRRGQEG